MATKVIAKPQLRGLLERDIKKHLTIACVLAIGTGIGWKVGVCDRRKKKYAEFYKNYDAEKEFQRMKAAGVLTSCNN